MTTTTTTKSDKKFNNRSLEYKTAYLVRKYKKYTHKHGLDDWDIRFNNKLGTCATTHYTGKYFMFSKKYIASTLTDKASIKDTILHEIAHALVGVRRKNNKWLIHDKVWRDKAISIGCSGKRCASHQISEPKDYKWLIKCYFGCEYRRHKLNKKRWDRCVCPKHKAHFTYIQQH